MGVFATEFWRRGLRPVKGSRIVLPFPVAWGRALVFPARMPDSHRLPCYRLWPRVVRYHLIVSVWPLVHLLDQEGLARAKPSGSCMTGPTVGCRRTACGRHRHPRLRPGVRSSRLSGMIPWDCPHYRICCHTIQSSLHSLVLGVICMGRARACEG